ncbi:MAG: SDR family oxidoreductase [Verrucomicrobiota bacterium]
MDTILITGANRGVGLALATKFLEEGWHVLATAREPEHATELAALGRAEGSRLDILPLDVTAPESVERLPARVAACSERLDVLVNNAGVFPEEGRERFEQYRPEWFEQALSVNVVGTVRVTQALLPTLRKGRRPRIVMMSSGAATITTKEDNTKLAYAVSKAGLNMLARGLAADLREEGITVTPVSPGWVKTEMGGENAKLEPAESAAGLFGTITGLKPEDAGVFLGPDGRRDTYKW